MYDSSRLAASLMDAHRTGRLVAAPDAASAPPDYGSADAIQSQVAIGLDREIGGWKTAISPIGPIAGPIYEDLISRNNAERPAQAPPVTGIEIEFAFRLKPGMAGAAGATDAGDGIADILPAIDGLWVGIELVASRYEPGGEVPFTAFLADNMSNAGYVLGDPVDLARLRDFDRMTGRVAVDGAEVFSGPLIHGSGDPLAPLGACLRQRSPGFARRAPQAFITTGNLCGLLAVRAPRRVEAWIRMPDGGEFGVACRFA